MNVLLIGAQGSGKGTQAALLRQTLGICHIASGDLFRKALDEETTLGLRVKTYLERGELVPDGLTMAMIMEHIAQTSPRTGILLDGFPRTIAQAEMLDDNLQSIGEQVNQVIYIEVPREKLFSRLAGRLICQAHQHVYNKTTCPPRVPGVCDIDGSELYQRADDQEEAIQKRLDIFFSQTIHLLTYYNRQHKLITVDGDQDINQVHTNIIDALSEKEAWRTPYLNRARRSSIPFNYQ